MIEWAEPPQAPAVQGRYTHLFDELRRNPGRWAVFKRGVAHPGGFYWKLTHGHYRGIEAGELEVRLHRGDDGLSTIYVRVTKEGTTPE